MQSSSEKSRSQRPLESYEFPCGKYIEELIHYVGDKIESDVSSEGPSSGICRTGLRSQRRILFYPYVVGRSFDTLAVC